MTNTATAHPANCMSPCCSLFGGTATPTEDELRLYMAKRHAREMEQWGPDHPATRGRLALAVLPIMGVGAGLGRWMHDHSVGDS